MKKMKKLLSLLLVLMMVFSLAPASIAANYSDTSSTDSQTEEDFCKIVHLDAARKYFTPDQIKVYIDEMADAGMNQLQIYFSDNQGFRLALDDMIVITTYDSYDLTAALGKGYEQTDKGMYPHDTDAYLTQSEMTDIISYAKARGIEIVPCFNSPGHMGAILEEFSDFCYSNSNGTTQSSIDLTNDEAVAFALAIVEKYVSYFASQGCKYFNLGGDEYANDVSGMGFSGLVSAGLYDDFVDYLNEAAAIVIEYEMIPRMFNDGAYYNNLTSEAYQLNENIQICYWLQDSGCASASTIAAKGHDMINTSKNLYYVVAESPWTCVTEASAANFVTTSFADGSTISNPVGSMMCVWCDDARDTTMTAETILSNTAAIAKVYGSTLPSTYNTFTDNNVSVSANNLTSVSVEDVTAPVIESALEGKVVAYDITPVTKWGNYTGKADVTMPVPDGWNGGNVYGYVVNSDGTITERIEGTYDANANTFTFEAPHFSTVGEYELDNSAPINGGSYTVSVNGTVDIPLDATGDVSVEDATYVTAGTIETTAGSYIKVDTIVSGAKYILVNQESVLTSNTTTGSNVYGLQCETGFSTSNEYTNGYFWTITEVSGGYTVQNNDGKYLKIVSSNGNGNVTFSDTEVVVSINDLGTTFLIGNGNTYLDRFNSRFAAGWGGDGAGSSNQNEQWSLYKQESAYKLPVTGVAVGTTKVWVGNTYYTINVVEENLTDVDPQTIYFQLSGYEVWDINDTTKTSVTIGAQDAYGETGVAVSTIVPAQGNWEYGSSEVPTVYWKATLLEDGEHQRGEMSINQCMNGDDFTHIRYYGGNWQILFSTTDTWRTVLNTDELVAYYLQQTQTTTEVTTYVQDWAYTTANSSGMEPGRYQKALSFAVVYPSGQMSPASEEDIYDKSTLIYWDNLANLGFIRFGVNEIYEVSKITYTMGERTDGYTESNWTSDDSITWNKTTLDDGSTYYDEAIVWDEKSGTEPVVDGAKLADKIYAGNATYNNSYYNGTWGANDAVLILIYLKPVVTEDSLTVQYWDDSTNSEIYNYPINVGNVTDENPASFVNRLVPSVANSGEITLADNAYVVNAKGVYEYFEKDLTQISDLKGKYSSGLYDYVKAEISDDGKTLILHYTLNSEKLQPYYIADFGLEIEIPFDDLGNGVVSVTASVPSSANGTVSVDSTNRVIKFTPNKAFSGVTVLSVNATFEQGDSAVYNVGIYPATTVYYEETFASLNGFVANGTTMNTKQQAVAYGNGSDHSVASNFGHDAVYADDAVGASNGTQVTSSTAGDTATFEFTGTGLDIYTNNTTSTGNLLAKVYAIDSNGTETLKKSFIVMTAMVAGTTPSTSNQAVTAYNVPVVSVSDLSYGKYKVVIQNLKKSVTEGAGLIQLDGFRVYGTLDYSSAVYVTDGETNPTFVELRDKVLAALNVSSKTSGQYSNQIAKDALSQVYSTTGAANGAVVISKDDSLNAQDLLDNGPKNEMYLYPEQSVVFSLGNVSGAQIGLKALDKAVTYTITGKNGNQTLSTSTDMFYELDTTLGAITITNKSGGILSITEIKAFVSESSSTAIFMNLTEDDLMPALMSLGYEAEPVYADATLDIAVNDADGNALATTQLTANGIEGEEATFAAADIQAAVATLELPDNYNLDDVTYSDVTVTYGSEDSVAFTAEKELTQEEKVVETVKQIFSSISNFFKKFFRW